MTKLVDIIESPLAGEWGDEDKCGIGIPVIRTTNFTNYGLVDYKNITTRIIRKEDLERKYLRKGDIIIEKSGGSDKQPVGRVIYFNGDDHKYLFNNFTSVLRVKNQTKWDSKYVFYSLYSNYKRGGTLQFENKTTGLHNLKLDSYIKCYDVLQRDLLKQKEISKMLDLLSSSIFTYKEILTKYDELIKARFVEMFGDPISNTHGLVSLSMTNVCEIIDGDRGKNYPASTDFKEKGYCLFLNAKNVTCNGFNFSKTVFITREKDESLRNGKLVKGDLVLTTRGTIGNLAFFNDTVSYEHIRINSGMVILRINHQILNDLYFIEQFKMQLNVIKKKIASGSAQPQLPISTMNKIKILVPPIELQNEFAEFVKQVDKSKLAVQKSLEKTQQLFDSLMQEYFG